MVARVLFCCAGHGYRVNLSVVGCLSQMSPPPCLYDTDMQIYAYGLIKMAVYGINLGAWLESVIITLRCLLLA